MSKLSKLKSYFTIKEAVKHLSSVLEETVTPSDVFRLALDNHLVLSVRLINQAYALGGRYIYADTNDINQYQVKCDLITNEALEQPYKVDLSSELQIDKNKWLLLDRKIHVLDGILDLAMIGSEEHEINKLYHKEVGEPEPVNTTANGFFLKQGELIYKLQKSLSIGDGQQNIEALHVRLSSLLKSKGLTVNDVVNSGNNLVLDCLSEAELDEFMLLNEAIIGSELSDNDYSDERIALDELCYQFVIRTSELTRFVQSLEDTPEEPKPLHDKERTTLMILLSSILKKANFDLNERGVAGKIRRATEANNTPISEQTIRNILPLLRDATELKQRN